MCSASGRKSPHCQGSPAKPDLQSQSCKDLAISPSTLLLSPEPGAGRLQSGQHLLLQACPEPPSWQSRCGHVPLRGAETHPWHLATLLAGVVPSTTGCLCIPVLPSLPGLIRPLHQSHLFIFMFKIVVPHTEHKMYQYTQFKEHNSVA